MAQGAVAGVMVLAGLVYFVLFGFAGMTVFWIVRSRRIHLPPPEDKVPPQ